MRSAGAGLAAFLDTATATPPIAHLVTVTPRTGSVVRWTDWPWDLTVSSNTFRAGGYGSTHPIVVVEDMDEVAGTEIGSLSMRLLCGEDALFNGVRLPLAAARGTLGGATVKVEVLYMPTPGDVSLGTMHLFEGPVGEVRPSSSVVELDVESGIALLNVTLPRLVFAPGCAHQVYDVECALVKASWTVTGTVSPGATTTSVPSNRTEATGTTNTAGWFGLGMLTFTSGANNGLARAVRAYSNTGGTFTLDRPLPVVPANGDTFSVYPGCPRTKVACENANAANGPAFNNVTHLRACPYVPRNETAL